MSKKNWVLVKRGLIQDPKHRDAMGNRVWLYLYIIDRCDWETGTVFEWRDKDEAEDMVCPWRTIQRQRQELEDLGYIVCKQARRGLSITIRNWTNPRNYSGEVINKGTQKRVPLENKGTHEGTQQVNLKLSTLSIRDQESLTTIEKNTLSVPDKPERPRDELFDALAEVCQVDPKTAGSTIAKVKVVLEKAGYTAADVRAFGKWWWGWKDRKTPPRVWDVQERIGILRSNGKPAESEHRRRPKPQVIP